MAPSGSRLPAAHRQPQWSECLFPAMPVRVSGPILSERPRASCPCLDQSCGLGVCPLTRPGSRVQPWKSGWAASTSATASWFEREVQFHKDRNRKNGCQVGRSGRWKPGAAALASLGGNLQDPSRFPSCSFGLMGNEKQNTEAASGQGVGGAQRCLLMESVINSS